MRCGDSRLGNVIEMKKAELMVVYKPPLALEGMRTQFSLRAIQVIYRKHAPEDERCYARDSFVLCER